MDEAYLQKPLDRVSESLSITLHGKESIRRLSRGCPYLMGNASDRIYHVAHGGRKFGPLSLAELSARRLSHDMLVWCEGMPEWVPIAEIPALEPYVRHAAVARTVAPPAGGGRPTERAAGIGPEGDDDTITIRTSGVRPLPPPPASAGRLQFVAITTIVLAVLGLLLCPFSIGVSLVGPLADLPALDVAANMNVEWTRIPKALVFGTLFLASISMLCGGIGLLKRRRWAATTLIISSVVCIMAHLAGTVIDGRALFPILSQAGVSAAPEVKGVLIGVLVGTALSMAGGIAWHIASLLLVNSTAVRGHLK